MLKPIVSIDLVKAALRSETMKQIPEDELRRDAVAYERFLELARRHPGPLAPTRAIDQMWHLHMLHPVAYHADCMRLFGRILDHDGGFGSVGEERPILGRVFERTARLWELQFSEPYVKDPGATLESCWHDCESRCWHACSSRVSVATAVATG